MSGVEHFLLSEVRPESWQGHNSLKLATLTSHCRNHHTYDWVIRLVPFFIQLAQERPVFWRAASQSKSVVYLIQQESANFPVVQKAFDCRQNIEDVMGK